MELEGWQMTFTEFNRRYEGNLTVTSTYIKAYEMTENIHYELTGEKRYSDYDSFRHVRNRKIKKQME